ncbi:transposase [Mesorhizobium plurifarium]|uniref:Transposase n=1 Tax=Mesorhizobium plurifarium TaxID=69974 RepID=A0A090F9E1_MESPL|nr:transposase [Mesorhizobium plurifarium]
MPIQQLVQIDEEEAYAIFRQFRWPKANGEPVCSHCGLLVCYALRRRAFKCSGCREFLPACRKQHRVHCHKGIQSGPFPFGHARTKLRFGSHEYRLRSTTFHFSRPGPLPLVELPTFSSTF